MHIYNGKESFKKNNGKERRTFQMGIKIHNHRMSNFGEVIVMLGQV